MFIFGGRGDDPSDPGAGIGDASALYVFNRCTTTWATVPTVAAAVPRQLSSSGYLGSADQGNNPEAGSCGPCGPCGRYDHVSVSLGTVKSFLGRPLPLASVSQIANQRSTTNGSHDNKSSRASCDIEQNGGDEDCNDDREDSDDSPEQDAHEEDEDGIEPDVGIAGDQIALAVIGGTGIENDSNMTLYCLELPAFDSDKTHSHTAIRSMFHRDAAQQSEDANRRLKEKRDEQEVRCVTLFDVTFMRNT